MHITQEILISIILTTYNRSHLLLNAVNSVLNGNYDNFEIIIVDDCSTDGTEQLIKEITDPRITYLKLQINSGVLAARNKGFDVASGDYITILDDDDVLLPDALHTVVERISEFTHQGKDPEILWFDCIDQESTKKSGFMPISDGTVTYEDYICGKIYGDFWLIFKKNVLKDQRFNEKLRAHESLFWLKLHRNHNAIYVPEVLCEKYREHGERLCNFKNRLKQLPSTTLALSEYLRIFGEDVTDLCPKRYGEMLAYLGLHQLLGNDFSTGRKSIINSFRYKFSVKYLLLYFSSFFLRQKQIIHLYSIIDNQN